MEDGKSNVERLIEAGALDPEDLTDEHADIVNTMFEPEEMETLVKMSKHLKKAPHRSSAAF
ncbi:MAG: hypothetical protein AAF566_01305 [Pseudomonadota bacterium]